MGLVSSVSKQYDKKIFRLLYILGKLDSQRQVSTDQMAEEFNVTHRTVQRDMELLAMTGFPLVSSDKGLHSFMEGFSLKKMMISIEEASLVSFLYEIAKSLGENFETSFREIFKKVLSPGKESVYYAKIPEGRKITEKYDFLGDLEKGVEAHQKLIIRYKRALKDNKEVTYKIKPLKIVYFDGFWYLLAHLDKARNPWLLKFRLDHIKEVCLTSEKFLPEGNLKTLLDENTSIWFSNEHAMTVTLKVSAKMSGYFKEKNYFPHQKIIKESPDGSLDIETKVSHPIEVLPTIFSWLPNINVISPPEFRQEVKEMVSNYLKSL